ncbi:cupredoxin domain-containing protein [Serratia proteamaculans]|uniref:cupredoxin domain-containing protein n=1 Tax=Serratia proteamaculans TaxID=28151 RepID=UPI003CFC5072
MSFVTSRLLRSALMSAGCLLGLSGPTWASPAQHYDFGQAATAGSAARTVEVVMGDMSFQPEALQIKAGETVRFVLINKGQLLHEFNLGDAAMHAEHQQEMLKMQQSGMLTPTAIKQMPASSTDHAAMGHGAMPTDLH